MGDSHKRRTFFEQLGFVSIVVLLRLFSLLPYALVARFGSALGAMLFAFPSSRKHIVLVNLRLCFPGKSEREYDDLARDHFRHVIRSYLERGIQWFGSAETIRDIVQIESKIDLEDGDAPPTIFMGFHFVGIEIGCMLYSMQWSVASLYTRMSNKALCDLARRQRGRFGAEMLERSTSARKIVGLLRSGKPVMLAADMDHGIRNSVFVPFFGVSACTLTSVSRLARLGNARVVPFVTEVLPDYQGYKLTIFEPLSDFPSASDTSDARRMNEFLETQIRNYPEQYYWVHRRFKNRPPGEAGVY
ncbi:lipid A biosynthesis lauroyl acyltransferase [Paraburkholderia dinghuensis]|uniref:Lipid A biosynthesis lauroyl acyltransferase n=1 Tax=Paraburkholderia dinghuensis TaxID=2305225 RepID=A0A3N6MI54_9BURK|nr:lipid A biosynthesis lauroyl acyltransferase [Paraburkholderia dinghuensis]RQH03824.1 lipid A biosynthesis lauroyl acyltransferase [Paraburkholderia dinghuensis]